MDRRGLLRTAGGLAALGGATLLLPAAADASPDAEAERHVRPVFRWERFGGFVGAGATLLTAPRLVVYADRTAIADAAWTVRLSAAAVMEVQRRAVSVLSDPANLRRRPGAPVIADAPSTRFDAVDSLRGQRRYTGTVEALEESRDQHAYPGPLYALLDDATALRRRTVEAGRPFTPDAVRLVVVALDPAGGRPDGPIRDWPAGVPVPPIAGTSRTGRSDLRGATARRVAHGIGRAPGGALWQTFRTGGGMLLQAAWRYLLPEE